MRNKKKNKFFNKITDVNAALIAEIIFTLLPLIILFIIFSYVRQPLQIFHMTEWAFAAAILSGQIIVKFITGLIKSGKPFRLGVIASIIAIIIVFLLAPSLVILTLITVSPEPVWWLSISQIALFILAVIVFFLLGKTSELATTAYFDDDMVE